MSNNDIEAIFFDLSKNYPYAECGQLDSFSIISSYEEVVNQKDHTNSDRFWSREYANSGECSDTYPKLSLMVLNESCCKISYELSSFVKESCNSCICPLAAIDAKRMAVKILLNVKKQSLLYRKQNEDDNTYFWSTDSNTYEGVLGKARISFDDRPISTVLFSAENPIWMATLKFSINVVCDEPLAFEKSNYSEVTKLKKCKNC